MEREEAIRRLRYIRMDYLGYPPFLEPIDMAIEALHREEAEEKGYCHRIKPKEGFMVDDMFCKSQLITCNRVKECNGVCPFEDALKHADKEMDEQTVIDHDRDWIIGCIKHDGFIKTDRFDKANQIILEALKTDLVRCKDCRHRDLFSCPLADNDFQKDEDFCSWGERKEE